MKKSSNAARDLAKKKAGEGSIINGSKYKGGQYELDAEEVKAGQDARKRASKSGTISGPTKVTSNYRNSKSRDTMAVTNVKSSRGNYYRVNETKEQVKGGPDKNRSTYISASNKDGSPRETFRPGK
jgi:hypothetical protein